MPGAPKKELTLFDSTCLIVGIIIGVGIYQMAPSIARGAGCWWGVLLIWLAGGILSLFGALGYAELASAYPKAGGDYVYLTRAFGSWAGFLFGWVQLAIVRPGDIAIMAFAFATYASQLYSPFAQHSATRVVYASLAIAVLTTLNILGVREGKYTQNILTVVKALGLMAILGVALAAPPSEAVHEAPISFPLGVAMIMVLFTFGGWNEMAFVAGEVKNPGRNIARALLLGTAAVTVLYLLANGAFLYTLGYNGMANSQAVASETVSAVFPSIAGNLVSALICISALGSVSGLIFAGARISYALGTGHSVFRYLGRWSVKRGTPVRALLVQGLLALVLVVTLGSFIDALIYTAATTYSFYFATSMAVLVLRKKEPHVARPFRVPGYPFPTLLFGAVCLILIYKAIEYKPEVALIPCAILLAGIPVYLITSKKS